ncbi:DUF3857 domain-containing protein [Flavihumibacter sp. R14]|nr:DUF3857 domain-containing protein [Flavihumibacter soli]
MKKIIIICLALGFALSAAAQTNYDVSRISPELLKNANAVIRTDNTYFEVKSAGKAELRTLYAVTILNNKADEFASFYSTYDKLVSISQLKVTVYNSKGEKVKSFNKADFKDRSLISDYTIYQDDRVKTLTVYETSYPYTVEYSEVKDYNGILTYPRWYTLSSFNVSLESSKYSISIPETLSLRYKESPLTKVSEEKTDGKKTYSWHAENISAFKTEPMSTGLRELVPWAVLSPNEFEYDNFTGNLGTWTSLGDWLNQLNKDGDILNEATAQKVKSLTQGVSDRKKKIEILYNYLQNSTRYVSVQLGIGGFKPIAADKVAQMSYGDCKALSNYMKALLKQVDIHSELVVLKSEESVDGSLYTDFSSIGQANHMILCVPAAKDTVWLECTSQRMPFGYLGSSNSNRTVLLVTKDGGKLVRTPFYPASANKQTRVGNVTINASGASTANITTEYENEQFDDIFGQLFREPVDQKKFLYESLSIANPEILSYAYEQPDKQKPKLVEHVSLKVNDLTATGGDKLFLTLNLMNTRSYVPELSETRLTNFALQMSYSDTDRINYELPKDYKVEFLPKDVQISSDFGEFSVKTTVEGNKITYIRTQKMYSKRYPPSRFKDLVEFYKSIYKADKQKAVLSKI